MRRAVLLAFLVVLLSPGCKAKPAPPQKPSARQELYKPLPTPAPPRAVPGRPTPKRALPD